MCFLWEASHQLNAIRFISLFVLNLFSSVQSFQSCPSLCNAMDCSMPSFPIHHQLPELTQAHVHRLGDAIGPSHPIFPFSSCLQSFLISGSFTMSQSFPSGGQIAGASASASVLPGNIQDWFPLGLTGWISCCPRDSQESSLAAQFKGISSLVLSLLYCPTLTFVHDYWKDHRFDYTDLCWKSDVSAF